MSEVPEGLGNAGAALWTDVCKERVLSAANKILLLNACRIADNLDRLNDATPAHRVVSENHLGTECIHPTISEFRQQVTALQNILSKLGVADLPAEGGGGNGFFDQLAAKRRERDAG